MQLTDSLEAAPMCRREPSAFRTFVEEHKRHVFYLALDLTGNFHDAEDLAQEVFIKAYRALDSFRGEAKLYTWLYRIAVNTFLNKRRKKALTFMRLRDDLADTVFFQENARSPVEDVVSTDVQQHIDAALNSLSPKERSAFVLRHYHDMPLKEIAGVLAVAEGTIKSLLFRAIQKLRKELVYYKDELGLAN